MEYVNAALRIEVLQTVPVAETICTVSQNEDAWLLTYWLRSADCLFDFEADANQIRVSIDKNYFDRFPSFGLEARNYSICCQTESALYGILNVDGESLVRQFQLESQVLQLVALLQKQQTVQTACEGCAFLQKSVEFDKIIKARDYILQNLDQSLTIPVVAGIVGTNQCYLKKGFKEVTGQTIFEFLQENRMVKARYLLQHKGLSVQEISSMVGYASASSFSQTYKNFFGLAPSLEQKQVFSDN